MCYANDFHDIVSRSSDNFPGAREHQTEVEIGQKAQSQGNGAALFRMRFQISERAALYKTIRFRMTQQLLFTISSTLVTIEFLLVRSASTFADWYEYLRAGWK